MAASIKHQVKKKEENNSGTMEASECLFLKERHRSPHTHLERLRRNGEIQSMD
jgi:hypothetical protein